MMDLSLSTLLVVGIPLILIEGFFSGAEIALVSADKLQLRKIVTLKGGRKIGGGRRAKRALDLASHPERVLSTTLLMTNLCIIILSALITLYMLQFFQGHTVDFYAILLTSPLVVIFGELIPKTIYQRYATRLAPWVALPVQIAYYVFYPITRVLSAYTYRVSRVVAPLEELLTGRRRTTRDELQALLNYGRRETEMKGIERQMIKRIFDFADAEAQHALIPLVKVEAIDDQASVRDALERFETHRHSRMPVYSERVDNIVGILDSSDLFRARDLSEPIREFVTQPHYVAETQSLEDLIREMTKGEWEIVVVVNEHGGAMGILTFEDIVEEIVGEIRDEYDSEPASTSFRAVSENSWLVQARMEIEQINSLMKLDLPSGEYESLSGFLLQQFGRIPETGDELFFDTQHYALKFTIKRSTSRRIEVVLIEQQSKD